MVEEILNLHLLIFRRIKNHLAQTYMHPIWMPVASVDVERSFSQYKHLLNDRVESLTEENTQRLVMLYHNGDSDGRFN